jgi:tetratricopeptide (TPR) repeat protein
MTVASAREQGLAALRGGNPAAAVPHLRLAVQQNPRDGDAWAGLGVALCQTGSPAEGVHALQQAVALLPGQAVLHCYLGRGLELMGQPAAALQAYQRALALDPAHTESRGAAQRLAAAVHAVPPPFAGPAPHGPTAPIVPGAPLPGGYHGPVPPMGARPGMPAPPPAARRSSSGSFPWALVIGIPAAIFILAVIAAVILVMNAVGRAASQASASGGSAIPPPGSTFFEETSSSGQQTRPIGLNPFSPAGGSVDLNSTAPGPQIRGVTEGFTAAFPSGFGIPKPGHQVIPLGMNGMGQGVSYDATGGPYQAFFACMLFPEEVLQQKDPDELLRSLRSALSRSMRLTVTQTDRTSFQGSTAEESRFEIRAGGAKRPGKMRCVLAKARVFVLGFVGRQPADADSPAAAAYLDSLKITEPLVVPHSFGPRGAGVTPPTMPSFPTGPSGPTGAFGPTGPRSFGPGGPSGFSPPEIHMPSPPEIRMPDPPSFPTGPTGPRFGPMGPRMGPMGPRFGPMGPSGSGDPSSSGGGAAGPGSFGPGSVPGGFGPGGAPNGFGPGGGPGAPGQ